MIGVKIIDVNTDNACEETIGTCELCMSSMYCDNPVITIEFPDGRKDSFDGYYWVITKPTKPVSYTHLTLPTT